MEQKKNKNKLEALIGKIVKLEIKKIAKPMIEEMVENRVNKIIVEQLLPKLLYENKKTTLEDVSLEIEAPTTKKANNKDAEKVKDILRKRLGIDESEHLQMIYEDVQPISSTPSAIPGMYQDQDDDGIDEDAILSLMRRR